jgi:hypothetical protein
MKGNTGNPMKHLDIVSKIPRSIIHHVDAGKAGHLTHMIASCRALVKELESVPDSTEATEFVKGHLERLENQASEFLSAAASLEKAAPALDQAHHAWAVAQERYAVGSDDATEAIVLRDDVEVRAQRRRRVEREFLDAKQACQGLPQMGILGFQAQMDNAQRRLARMSFCCAMKHFEDHSGRGDISSEVTESWLALGPDDLRWEPLALEREVAHSAKAKHEHVSHHGHIWRTNDEPFSEEEDLRKMYGELVAARRSRKAAAVARAKGALVQAEREAAQ